VFAVSGLALPELYLKCREAFLVNSDLTLRTQLTEFKDHKLIKTKKVCKTSAALISDGWSMHVVNCFLLETLYHQQNTKMTSTDAIKPQFMAMLFWSPC